MPQVPSTVGHLHLFLISINEASALEIAQVSPKHITFDGYFEEKKVFLIKCDWLNVKREFMMHI